MSRRPFDLFKKKGIASPVVKPAIEPADQSTIPVIEKPVGIVPVDENDAIIIPTVDEMNPPMDLLDPVNPPIVHKPKKVKKEIPEEVVPSLDYFMDLAYTPPNVEIYGNAKPKVIEGFDEMWGSDGIKADEAEKADEL